MFDIGFAELLIVAVVALVVLGPEKLPTAARAAGHLAPRVVYLLRRLREYGVTGQHRAPADRSVADLAGEAGVFG